MPWGGRSGRRRDQYQLAGMGIGVHHLVGFAGLGERKCRVDHRLDRAGFDQRPNFLADGGRQRALLVHAARAQRRAGERQPLAHDQIKVDLDLVAAQKRDLHDPPALLERGDVAWRVVAAHHVEDHVDALGVGRLADDLGEVLGLVVDRPLRAERHAGGAFLGRPGGREHARAEGLGHLDRRGADAAGTAMDQETLAALEAGDVEDVRPHRKHGLGQRRCLDHAQPLGDRQALRRRRGRVLGIAAARDKCADLVANGGPGHARTDRHHRAGELEARDIRRARWRGIAALALQDIWAVHAGRGHLDQHLAERWPRQRAGRGLQGVGPAGRSNLDGGHHRGQGLGHGTARHCRHTKGVAGLTGQPQTCKPYLGDTRSFAMDLDDLEPRKPVAKPKDLSPWSIAELEEYIGRLQAEIERARGAIKAKQAQRAGAEAFFKKG